MRLGIHLQDNRHVARIESLAPDRFDGLPLPAATRDFTRFGSEADLGGPFVASDQLDWQVQSGLQDLCRIISSVPWRDPAKLNRILGILERVKTGNSARFGKGAGHVVLGGAAEIFEFTRIEFDSRFTDDLVNWKLSNVKPSGFATL